jgi:hypothetical protein
VKPYAVHPSAAVNVSGTVLHLYNWILVSLIKKQIKITKRHVVNSRTTPDPLFQKPAALYATTTTSNHNVVDDNTSV